MEFLGWYTIGDLPNADDIKFHEQVGSFFSSMLYYSKSMRPIILQVCADHENSLLIKLNPVARTSQVHVATACGHFCCYCCTGLLASSHYSFVHVP
jgi:hypothetical protein